MHIINNSIDYTNINKVFSLITQGENIFITGPAGTGKSFILNELKKIFKDYITLTATTGIAAGNIDGITIHSWSGIKVLQYTIPEIIWKCKRNNILKCNILVIDEVSMLSAFVLEYLDTLFKKVRNNNYPFGGIQVILIGDFLQLPPVATDKEAEVYCKKEKYCFESEVWEKLNLKTVYLSKIYRQENISFCNLLNNFRQGCLTRENIREIKKRHVNNALVENKLHIYTHKAQAANYNKQQLDKISSKEYYFEAFDSINKNLYKDNHTKKILWTRMDKNIRPQEVVVLKQGCRVMALKNYPDLNIYNGSCGIVTKIDENTITVKFDNGSIKRFSKEPFDYFENETQIGCRVQVPLILAYATTIHKAQGLTLDEVVIDCSDAFTYGQVYVALSRVRSLENLYILNFNEQKVHADKKVQMFYKKILENKLDLQTQQAISA